MGGGKEKCEYRSEVNDSGGGAIPFMTGSISSIGTILFMSKSLIPNMSSVSTTLFLKRTDKTTRKHLEVLLPTLDTLLNMVLMGETRIEAHQT